MAERRHAARKKRRFLVSFELEGHTANGFTRDVSLGGLFVATPALPRIGQVLEIKIHSTDGQLLVCAGKVVRARRTHPALASSNPTGFSLVFSQTHPKYPQLIGE